MLMKLTLDGLHRGQQPGGRVRLQERDLCSSQPRGRRLASGQRARAEAIGGHKVKNALKTSIKINNLLIFYDYCMY